MARTEIIAQQAKSSPNQLAFVAANAAGGHAFRNSPRTIVMVRVGGTATNLTAQTPGVTDAGAIPDKMLALTTAQIHALHFDPNLYNQDDGTCWIDFSSVTAVDVAVLEP